MRAVLAGVLLVVVVVGGVLLGALGAVIDDTGVDW